jgi:hypothetical protein
VLLDEVELNAASWGVPIPVDAGPHTLHASAPDHHPSSTSLDVPSAPTNVAVTIAPLLPEPKGDGWRVPAIGAGAAVSALAVGAMAFFGTSAIVAEDQKPASCAGPSGDCADQWRHLEDRRTTDSAVATVSGGIAVAAIATTLVIWLWPRDHASEKSAQARFVLTPGGGGGGAAVRF